MKNVIKFLIFITYSTCIFFLPNNNLILVCFAINLFVMLLTKRYFKNTISRTFNILPYIIFTFFINLLIDNFTNALWIGIKLILVCNITITYSNTTSIIRSSRNNTNFMHTFKNI